MATLYMYSLICVYMYIYIYIYIYPEEYTYMNASVNKMGLLQCVFRMNECGLCNQESKSKASETAYLRAVSSCGVI